MAASRAAVTPLRTQFDHQGVVASWLRTGETHRLTGGSLMFARNSSNDSKTVDLRSTELPKPGQSAPARPPGLPSGGATGGHLDRSIIGNDLKILGQQITIICKGSLQLDGEIQGDIHGSEIIVGEQGKVTGTIAAETVLVHGQVAGTIRGVNVVLKPSARCEGDIHHHSLEVDQGAVFEGRVRRPQDPKELLPTLDPANVPDPRGAA